MIYDGVLLICDQYAQAACDCQAIIFRGQTACVSVAFRIGCERNARTLQRSQKVFSRNRWPWRPWRKGQSKSAYSRSMSQSSTNPLEQREKEESMNYYRLVSLWIVFAAFCIFGWINHREHTIALEAQNGWRAAVAELHRCSQQAHAAAFDANLRFEQLQADVACALGEKPQPGFWTKVRTVDGGMWIWFTGDEFVEVGRWATLAATNPATALHATDEPAKDKFQARYGVRP